MKSVRMSRLTNGLTAGLTSLALVLGCMSERSERVSQSSQALGTVPGTWNSEGPRPIRPGMDATGATHRALLDPTNPHALFVASVNGGLFRSDAILDPTPASPLWTPLGAYLPSLSISGLAMDPLDSRHMVMVTGKSASLGKATAQGLVYVTHDGGKNWATYDDPLLRGNYLSSVSVRGSLILISSTGPERGPDDIHIRPGAVFRSTNDGVAWQDLTQAGVGLPSPIGPVRDLIADPTTPNAFYIAALDRGIGGAGLYRGTNGGDVWTRVSDNDTAPAAQSLPHALGASAADGVRLATAPNGMLLIEVDAWGHEVYVGYTRDQGQHFTAMDTPKFLRGNVPLSIKSVTRGGDATIVVETSAPHGLESWGPWLVRLDKVQGFPDVNGDWTGQPYTEPGQKSPSLTKFQLIGRFTNTPGDGTTTPATGTGGTYQLWWDTHDDGQGDLHSGTVIDPNSTLVYVAGATQVARGNTAAPASNKLPSEQWVPISGGGFTPNDTAPHADVRQLLLSPGGALIAMSDGGPYIQQHPSDPASDWQSLAGDMVTAEMHHLAVDTRSHAYIAGTQDNGSPTQFQKSTKSPIPWTQVEYGDGNTVAVDGLAQRNGLNVSFRYTAAQDPRDFQRHVFNENGDFVVSEVPALYDPAKSKNLREEEVMIGAFVKDLAYMVFNTNPYAGGRLVLGAQTFGVWESKDAGETVTLVPGSPTRATHLAYGAPSNPDLLWISALDGVYKRVPPSTTAVKTMYDAAAFGAPLSIAISPSDPAVAFVTTERDVWTTLDGGDHWTSVTGDLSQITAGPSLGHVGVLRSIALIPSTGSGDRVLVGAAEDGVPGVFAMATANPKVWTRVGTNLPNVQVWDLAYDPVPDTLAIGTLGRGAYSIDGVSQLDRAPSAACKDVTVIADSSCQANVAPSAFDNGSRDPDGGALSFSAVPSGPYRVGTYGITLNVSDPQGASASCSKSLIVKDSVPPQITAPAKVSVTSCNSTLSVNVGQATATDNCAGQLMTSGQVISRNGTPLSPTIPVLGGQVTLSPGTYVIQWTASDGFNTVSATQSVTVAGAIQTSDTFTLDDNADVRNALGGSAAIYNSGAGTTTVGQHSHVASVLSRGPVRVLHGAVVDGDITTGNRLFPDADITITGKVTEFANVQLPALPSLPTFPPVNFPGFTADRNQPPKTPAPGSYSTVTAANGGTVIFAAGDYYFQNLYINSGSTVRVDPKTRIFVRDMFTFNAPLLALSGTRVESIYLGYAGTNLLGMYAVFNGTLLAPNAKVTFGTGAGLLYTGTFWARALEVTPGSALVCRAS